VANPPPIIGAGASFSVTDTVLNRGSVDAVASVTRYYLSADAAKGAGDKLLTGTREVPALTPHASSAGTVTVTVPTATALGAYFLLACADDTVLVAESGEANNCIAAATKLEVLATGTDLVERAVSNPPSSVRQGGSFSATDTVANQGVETAAASVTRYYLSADETKSANDVALAGTRPVPALLAGASSTGTVAVTVSIVTPAGGYFLLACADDPGLVDESSEANNCIAAATRLEVLAARTDLVESAVSDPPSSVRQGGSFSVTDTAMNQGEATAAASVTRYYLSADATKTFDAVALDGTRPVPALLAGASSTGTVSLTVPTATALGEYFLLACADDTGVVDESDEVNNCIAAASTVQVTTGGIDLVESAVSNPPSSVRPGESFSVTDTATNQGGATAVASVTSYYLSLDAVKSARDIVLTGTRAVPTLDAGAVSTGTATVKLATSAPLGTYFLLACADATALVAESNEGNNCRAAATTVLVSRPDLIESAIGTPLALTRPGESVTVSDTARNIGNAPAPATTTRYYLSVDTAKSIGDVLLSGKREVPALAPTEESAGSRAVTYPHQRCQPRTTCWHAPMRPPAPRNSTRPTIVWRRLAA
jgi:trimeric autotransporter adhesin